MDRAKAGDPDCRAVLNGCKVRKDLLQLINEYGQDDGLPAYTPSDANPVGK